MEIYLHLGAHRTASTLLQNYLSDNSAPLRDQGVFCWGPERLRGRMFSGLLRNPNAVLRRDKQLHQRAIGRIRMELDRAEQNGARKLIISDQNMLGSLRQNFDTHSFYNLLRARLARLAPALGGADLNIGFSIRSYDTFLASVIGKRLMAGFPEPSADTLDLLVTQPRRWSHVITDISRVFPEADLTVWPYESWGAQPAQIVAKLLNIDTSGLRPASRNRVNTSRDSFALNQVRQRFGFTKMFEPGQYMPFDVNQRDKLRGDYTADLEWLAKGAGGRANYYAPPAEIYGDNGWQIGAPRHKNKIKIRAQVPDDKGSPHDRQEARMG